jgi:hypothetical protein
MVWKRTKFRDGHKVICKGTTVPVKDWRGPYCSNKLRLLEFLDNHHIQAARLSALHTDRLYPLKISLVLISVRDWVHPTAIMRPEEISQWKIPTPWGIEPTTFRLVTQYVNQLRPCVPHKVNRKTKKFRSTCMKLQRGHTEVTEWTRKLRSGQKISGWTESFALHTLFREDTYSFGKNKNFRGEQKVSRWIQSFGVDTKLRQQSILRKGIYKLPNYQLSPGVSSEGANLRQPWANIFAL